VLYSDGPWWAWLAARDLLGDTAAVPVSAVRDFRFRQHGRLRRTPPAALTRVLLRKRIEAPVDVDFRTWVRDRHGAEAAELSSRAAGVATFDADPGRLSAAFVWERLRRAFSVPPAARYVVGGWGGLVDRLAERARDLGVVIETGARVTTLPDPPVVVATSLDAAGVLLGVDLPAVPSGDTVLVDVAVRARRGDAFVVSDLDEAGWLERFSLPDPTLAPAGESLVQGQLPLLDGESRSAAVARLEAIFDLALPHWRDRLTWRRDAVARGRTGALDLPGTTWRDRPAIDRGDGVFLAGDQVAAPGLLSEVSFHSALAAATGAMGTMRRPAAGRPRGASRG
jgi:phytoene dehydrogenase-like protein